MQRWVVILLLATGLFVGWPDGVGAQDSARVIKHISGDLYSVRDHFNTYSAFLVTPEGIILGDPVDPDTASWLNTELQRRTRENGP